MASSFRWVRPPTQAWDANRYITVLEGQILDRLWYWCPRIEADMKQNAIWTDRSSNARQTLASFAYKKAPHLLSLVAKQQMKYGKWLELCNQGRYAIVMPTLQMRYREMWRSVGGR